MSLTSRILKACETPAGLSLSELAEQTGDRADTCNTIAGILCRDGRLFKAGVLKFYRYFANQADARAWDLVAEADYAARMKESAERKRLAKNERQRKYNLAGKPPTVEKPKAPKPAKVAAPVVMNGVKPQPSKVAVTVTWPEHVKVQVHPAPSSRFAFNPPPGWRGQITEDWLDRRLQGV